MNEQQESVSALEELREGLRALRAAHEQNAEAVRRLIAQYPVRDAALTGLKDELDGQKAVLAEVRQEVAAIARTVDSIHEEFAGFLERYGRHQAVANARAELSQLTVIWKADYADRQRTRNLARGLVHELTAQAVRDGSVDPAVIDACVAERWLAEPTYWLAPAAMAVAARHRGDDGQVSRATSYAFSCRDPAKSKLFFALTWSRMGRLSEAASWMDRYLRSLRRDELGPEFTVLLDAIADAELGHEALTYASETMARWFREDPAALSWGPASSSTRLRRWQPWLRRFSAAEPTDGFAALRELSGGGWDVVEESWKSATAASGAARYLMEEFPAQRPVSGRKGQYTDRALDHLIDQQEPDEARLRRRMAQLQKLIDQDGNTQAVVLGDPTLEEETLDFVTLLERAVFAPESLSLGPPGRRFALSCVWESVREATAALALRSRTSMPATVVLTVDGWSCEVPTHGSGPLDTVQVAEELHAYQESRIRSHVESVAPSWALTLGCGALAVLDAVLLLPFLTGIGFALFLLLAVALGCGALWGIIRVPVRRHGLREEGVRRQAESVRQLNEAMNQVLTLSAEWRHGLAVAARLETWSPVELGEDHA
ncbi:hypothetical protein [Streptomyces sp. NPDC101178]|uniref:hypothetical protein n=1 Tax=Streptomyces sp. NPDC101178 TaxID=3366124 RepID=UPI00382AAE26